MLIALLVFPQDAGWFPFRDAVMGWVAMFISGHLSYSSIRDDMSRNHCDVGSALHATPALSNQAGQSVQPGQGPRQQMPPWNLESSALPILLPRRAAASVLWSIRGERKIWVYMVGILGMLWGKRVSPLLDLCPFLTDLVPVFFSSETGVGASRWSRVGTRLDVDPVLGVTTSDRPRATRTCLLIHVADAPARQGQGGGGQERVPGRNGEGAG